MSALRPCLTAGCPALTRATRSSGLRVPNRGLTTCPSVSASSPRSPACACSSSSSPVPFHLIGMWPSASASPSSAVSPLARIPWPSATRREVRAKNIWPARPMRRSSAPPEGEHGGSNDQHTHYPGQQQGDGRIRRGRGVGSHAWWLPSIVDWPFGPAAAIVKLKAQHARAPGRGYVEGYGIAGDPNHRRPIWVRELGCRLANKSEPGERPTSGEDVTLGSALGRWVSGFGPIDAPVPNARTAGKNSNTLGSRSARARMGSRVHPACVVVGVRATGCGAVGHLRACCTSTRPPRREKNLRGAIRNFSDSDSIPRPTFFALCTGSVFKKDSSCRDQHRSPLEATQHASAGVIFSRVPAKSTST